jgi:quercetin dioxygenase-like cupin family protein
MTDVLVPDVSVSAGELERRTVRRSDWVSCKAAFIDCRTPGSDRKENYAFIGPGVSQNADQFVNLTELHGYNVGAAAMPNGVTNNLHLHFTAEVFINFGGTFRLRWGVDGKQGEYISNDGDVITVPTWIFRGFTNEGPDDGILLTVLGHDVTGGIIWGPSVLEEAESYGLYLTADSRLIDTVAGDAVPTDVPLIKPMEQRYIDELTTYTVEEMRQRVIQPSDRTYSKRPFLCTDLRGGGAELALAIGFGMSEDRRQVPKVHEPHSFNLSWLRAAPGDGILRHRHSQTQVLTVKSGAWEVTLNEGDEQQTVRLGVQDALSVPAGSWRTIRCVGAGVNAATDGTAELLVVNSGDGRVRLEWAPEVVDAAFGAGWMLDPNGYLAPVAVLVTATIDD